MKTILLLSLLALPSFAGTCLAGEIPEITVAKIAADLKKNLAVQGALAQGRRVVARGKKLGTCREQPITMADRDPKYAGAKTFQTAAYCTSPDHQFQFVIEIEGTVWGGDMDSQVDSIKMSTAG